MESDSGDGYDGMLSKHERTSPLRFAVCGFEDDFIVSQPQGCSRIDWSSHYMSRRFLVHSHRTI